MSNRPIQSMQIVHIDLLSNRYHKQLASHDAYFASNLEKTVEPHNFGVSCSKEGIGWCSILIALFKYFGSK